MNLPVPGIAQIDGIAQMSRFVDVELGNQLRERFCIFVIHNAVHLEIIFFIHFLYVADAVQVYDGVHEILSGHIHMLQLKEDPLPAEFVGIPVPGLDSQERFIKRQRPGGCVHEEVVRQILQSQAQAVMLRTEGIRCLFEHRVFPQEFRQIVQYINGVLPHPFIR